MKEKKTILKYEDLEDIIIKEDENITDSRLNESFSKLLENDKSLSPINSRMPGLWECLWFNDDTVEGYKKGYAVWYNTEDTDKFIRIHKDEMYQYGLANKYLVNRIKPYDDTDKEIDELYHGLLSGLYREDYGMTKPLPPLYDIGDIKDSVQLYVSQIDNNKIPPSQDKDGKYWKPFLKQREVSIVQNILKKLGNDLYNEHIRKYHLGMNKDTQLSDTFLKDYLEDTPENISIKQNFQDHVLKKDLNGFDYIKKEIQLTHPQTIDLYRKVKYNTYRYELSDINYILKEDYNSEGDENELKKYLSNTINYKQVVEKFYNQLSDGEKVYGEITYTLSSTYMQGSEYPRIVKWKDREQVYEYKNMYSVSFIICDRSISSINDNTMSSYYRLEKPIELLSSIKADDPTPGGIDGYRYDGIISSEIKIEKYGTKTVNIPYKWFRMWNSGYLEHGGVISVDRTGDVISVDLDWEYTDGDQTMTAPVYDYPQDGNESFYGLYDKFSDSQTSAYEANGNLQKDNRYVISLTPITDGYGNDKGSYNVYMNSEICGIRNSSFQIKIPSNSNVRQYRYSISGFRRTGAEE